MNTWLKVDVNEESTKATERPSQGLQLLPSPYDIPQAVCSVVERGTFERRPSFTIRLNYVDDEPLRRVSFNRGVELRLGKNSNRLYGLSVKLPTTERANVGPDDARRILEAVFSAIEELLRQAPGKKREKNYRMVRNVIRNRSSELVAGLVTK